MFVSRSNNLVEAQNNKTLMKDGDNRHRGEALHGFYDNGFMAGLSSYGYTVPLKPVIKKSKL